MPLKTFFLDNGQSGDRLVREWLQNTPAAWSSTYLAPYHTYKYTNAGGVQQCVLMSHPEMSVAELNILLKATNADAMMGAFMRNTRTTVLASGCFYLWCTGGLFALVFVDASGATPVLTSVAYVVDITKWHHLKVRASGKHVQAKIWVDGTAEPAWMIDYWIRYGYVRPNGTIGLMATIRDVYYARIQLGPIPRTGGP